MKKIVSILLSAILMLTLAVPAFASELSEDSTSAQSTMTYSVEGGYIIVIPETIDIQSGFSLTASRLNIARDKQVNVYLNSIQDDYITFTSEQGDTIDVHITGHDSDNRVAVFTDLPTTDYVISGYIDEHAMSAARVGEYTATVEFTVSLGERDPIE